MYQLCTSVQDGRCFYGVKYGDFAVENITLDFLRCSFLIYLMNYNQASFVHVHDIIEDFFGQNVVQDPYITRLEDAFVAGQRITEIGKYQEGI